MLLLQGAPTGLPFVFKQMRRILAAGTLLSLVYLLSPSSDVLRPSSIFAARYRADSTPRVTVQIGPVEVIRGPDGITDNPFNTLPGVLAE